MIASSYSRLAQRRSYELSKSISYSFLLPSFALPAPPAPLPPRKYSAKSSSKRSTTENTQIEDALVVLQTQSQHATTTRIATPALSRRSTALPTLRQSLRAAHDDSTTRVRGIRTASTMAAPAPPPETPATSTQPKEEVGNKGKRKPRPKRTRTEDKEKVDTPPPPRPIPLIPSTVDPSSSSTPSASSPTPSHPYPSNPESDNLPLSLPVSPFYSVHLLPHPTASQIKSALRNIPHDSPFQLLQKYRKLIIDAGLMKDREVISDLVCGFIGMGEYSPGLRFHKEAVRGIVNSSTESDPTLPLVFHAPIIALIRKEKYEWVTLYTNVAIASGTVDTPLLSYRIRSLVQLKRYRDIPYTFDLFQLHRLTPTGNIYDDVVLSLLLNGDLPNAQKVLAEKSDRGFRTTVLTCLALLEGMRQFGGNKVMEAKILSDRAMAVTEVVGMRTAERVEEQRTQLKGNVVVLNRIMSIRVERGDLDGALKVLDYFNTHDLPFDLAIPLSIPPSRISLSDVPIIKPALDLASFTILIGLSSKFRRLDCALDLFQQSQELRLGTNDYVLAAVIKSLVVAGEIGLAKNFFLNLADGTARLPNRPLDKIKPFKPTNRLFEALWWGILQDEGLEGANLILSKFAYHDALPSTRLSPYSNISVTDTIVSALVQYLTKVRNRSSIASTTKMCAELIVRVSKLTKGDRKATIEDLNALLDVAWQKERFRNTSNERYFARRMEKRPIVLPSSTPAPTPSLPAFDVAPLPTTATTPSPTPTALSRIKSSLDSRGVKNNLATTEIVLRNDRAFQSIESRWEYLQREVIDKGMRPTHLHFAYIIRAYIELGDIYGAREVLGRAKEAGCAAHVSWYSILIGGCNRLGKPQLAREILDELVYVGLKPDRLLFNTLALGFARRGNLEGVLAVQRQAQQHLDESPVALSTDLDADLIFITLRYRALVVASKLFQAQLYVKKILANGVVPDLALLKVLHTTGRYLRNKVNAAARRGGGVGGRLFESASSRVYGAEKIIHYHANNLRDARRLYTKSLSAKGGEELRKFDEFWVGKRKGVGSVEAGEVREGDEEGKVYPVKKMTTVRVRGVSAGKRHRRGARRSL